MNVLTCSLQNVLKWFSAFGLITLSSALCTRKKKTLKVIWFNHPRKKLVNTRFKIHNMQRNEHIHLCLPACLTQIRALSSFFNNIFFVNIKISSLKKCGHSYSILIFSIFTSITAMENCRKSFLSEIVWEIYTIITFNFIKSNEVIFWGF